MDQSDKAYLPYKSDCHDIAEKLLSDDGHQFKYTTHREGGGGGGGGGVSFTGGGNRRKS